MTTTASQPIREGFHTITPYLVVQEAAELIDFVKQAFGAEEKLRTTGSAAGIHAEVQIGDSMLMIGGGGAWRGTPMPTAIHLYVRDADATYRRALQAGATSLYEPIDQPYGDREGGVKDCCGNSWYIATHRATGYLYRGLRSITPALHPRGASALIGFLKSAFGAEETERADSPEGSVLHAKLRIGDSIVELSDAHGPFQPMPTMIMLYVGDADAWYRRAIQAGATSLSAPAEQPFGRMGGVQDPAGNHWYITTHKQEVPP